MNYKKEIELAIKRENPNWDGKSFDYGCSIYQNVLECYEAMLPIIEKAGHSGFSYNIFVEKLTRLLEGKVLTPITEQDFEDEFPKESGLGDHIDEDGTITRQCTRYSALFRHTHKDGTIVYSDVNRVACIDQYGLGWHAGFIEDMCKDLIPEIKLPYIPTDKPIFIYYWTFSYDKNKGFYQKHGEYNSAYIKEIIFPNGEAKQVNRLYLDLDNSKKPTKYDEKLFDELNTFIKKDIRKHNLEWYPLPRDKKGRFVKRKNLAY